MVGLAFLEGLMINFQMGWFNHQLDRVSLKTILFLSSETISSEIGD